MRYLVILLALAGCTGTTETRPYQDVYVNYVWHNRYGMANHPPEVEWIHEDGWTVGGSYYDGFTWAGWKVQVACGVKCDWPIEGTALSHELMHERTFERTGDVDAYHYRGDWALAEQVDLDATFYILRLRSLKSVSDEAVK